MFGWLRKPKKPELGKYDKYLSDDTCPNWARPTVANMVHVTGLLMATQKRLDDLMSRHGYK